MPRINFTVRKIDSLKPSASGQIDYWDKALPGFGVRLSPGGRKSFIVMYRAGGRKRRFTIGTHPPMSVAVARMEAKAILVEAQKGGDPAAEKATDRKAETFAQLAERYVENYAKEKKKSWRTDENALRRDVIPSFGNRRVREITRRDIRALLAGIKDRGAPIQANRTFEIVRRLFNWAVEEDYLTDSPCKGVKKPAGENQRDRVLREAEIRKVWKAFNTEPPATAAVFKLRLITAQRGGEVMSMRWRDIDFDSGWWTIPGKFAKNGLSHRVPLSGMAFDLLKGLRGESANPRWVFPNNSVSGHLEAVVHAAMRIRERCKVADFVPHDLRRTAASYMTSMGVPRLAVKKVLNHMDRDVTATYDRHSYDPEKLACSRTRLRYR